MLILGIESSCDDTSVALLNATDEHFEILAEKTASQIEVHKKYGGVVPEIAGRCHAENILPVVEEVLAGQPKPDVIAVTSGPGLITGLLVGVEVAKSLSYLWDVPLIGVNHIEGHLYSVLLPTKTGATVNPSPIRGRRDERSESEKGSVEFPALALIVSGGHTELILMRDHGEYEIIGKTRDDAAGECFDKVANLLGFDYPGGPKISKAALEGNVKAIDFPRPMLDQKDFSAKGGQAYGLDFSFAGLKTSALYWLRDNTIAYRLSPIALADFCASFEQAIVDVLVGKTLRAAKQYNPKTIILGGGVSANKKLRETLREELKQKHPKSDFRYPTSEYCMDNGAMIAIAGYWHALKKEFTPWQELTVDPNWKIDA